MTDYIISYKNYLTDEKHSSKNTVESYMRDLNQFQSYCTAEKIDDIRFVDNSVIRTYLDYLSGMGKSDATKLRLMATLRSFFRYLSSKGIVDFIPTEGISVKKTVQTVPGILDAGEVVLLLSQPDGADFKSIRDKAMLEILYATGIKVSELIDLRLDNVNLQIGIIHLSSGNKERIIPMYPAAVKSLANYLVHVRPTVVPEEAINQVFTNMNGKPMTRQGFWKIIKHYADTAGIKKDITPHTLRHSFAAHLLENGASLDDVKDLLGHSDISSTKIYAQMLKNKYTSAYSKFHPMSRVK